jgi:hypothetical protein
MLERRFGLPQPVRLDHQVKFAEFGGRQSEFSTH